MFSVPPHVLIGSVTSSAIERDGSMVAKRREWDNGREWELTRVSSRAAITNTLSTTVRKSQTLIEPWMRGRMEGQTTTAVCRYACEWQQFCTGKVEENKFFFTAGLP